MSHKKDKAFAKTARKALRKELTNDLTEKITIAFNKFEPGSKKAAKEIQKAANRLAKKLSSIVKVDKPLITLKPTKSTDSTILKDEAKTKTSKPKQLPAVKTDEVATKKAIIPKPGV